MINFEILSKMGRLHSIVLKDGDINKAYWPMHGSIHLHPTPRISALETLNIQLTLLQGEVTPPLKGVGCKKHEKKGWWKRLF